MSISIKKAFFGLTLSVIVIGVAIPVAFWFAAKAIDGALGWGHILSWPVGQILAATCLLIGVFWVSWSYSYLLFVGEGLPLDVFGVALHPTRTLVTTGPYAYVRNPALIGLLFLLLGVAFLQRSLAGAIMVPVVAVIGVLYMMLFEEPSLAMRFGKRYQEYKENVPLLIPRLEPYVHETVTSGS